MMIGQYSQSYHVFINLDGKNPMSITFSKVLEVIASVETNFSHFGGRTFIYSPSFGFKYIWKMIKAQISEANAKMTKFVQKGQEGEFFKFIDAEKWERRFGGRMEDYEKGQFWPPRDFSKSDVLTKYDIFEQNLHAFWVLSEDLDKKIWAYESDESQAHSNKILYNQRLVIHQSSLHIDLTKLEKSYDSQKLMAPPFIGNLQDIQQKIQLKIQQDKAQTPEVKSLFKIENLQESLLQKHKSVQLDFMSQGYIDSSRESSILNLDNYTTYHNKQNFARQPVADDKTPWYKRVFGFCCAPKDMASEKDKHRYFDELVRTGRVNLDREALGDINVKKMAKSMKIEDILCENQISDNGNLSFSSDYKNDSIENVVLEFSKQPSTTKSNRNPKLFVDMNVDHMKRRSNLRGSSPYHKFEKNIDLWKKKKKKESYHID